MPTRCSAVCDSQASLETPGRPRPEPRDYRRAAAVAQVGLGVNMTDAAFGLVTQPPAAMPDVGCQTGSALPPRAKTVHPIFRIDGRLATVRGSGSRCIC